MSFELRLLPMTCRPDESLRFPGAEEASLLDAGGDFGGDHGLPAGVAAADAFEDVAGEDAEVGFVITGEADEVAVLEQVADRKSVV